MFDEKAREFLKTPRIARLATNGPDGYPHVIPLWFMLDGDDVVMVSERPLRKVKNLRENPKASVQVGGEPGDTAAYLIRGTVTISDDTNNEWTNKLTYHYESKEEADKHVVEWADLDMLVLRLKPVSVLNVLP